MSFFYDRLMPQSTVEFKGENYTLGVKKERYVVLEHPHTGVPRTVTKSDLVKAKNDGDFYSRKATVTHLFSALTPSQKRKVELDEKIAEACIALNAPFALSKDKGKSKLFNAQVIARNILDDEGEYEEPTPSKSALHRLVHNFKACDGDLANLLVNKNKSRGHRFASEIERIMSNSIDTHYLQLNKPSISSTYREMQRTCPVEYKQSLPDESTLRRRIGDLNQALVIKQREGEDAYRNYMRSSKSKVVVDKLLERVELDAMHITLGLVDEKGVFIGYFVLYLAIDTASRMVVGYHIEPKTKLRGETPSGVLASINSIMSEQSLCSLDDYTAPIAGIPLLVVMDHGTAYQCKPVIAQLKARGIAFENTGTKRGAGKGIIERFIKLLRELFFRDIKGYRDSKLAQRYIDSRPPKKDNCVKLKELRVALEHFIYAEYANRMHSGIEYATPKQMWETLYNEYPTLPAEEVDFADIAAEHKKLTPHLQNGIRFKYQHFKSDALKALCDQLGTVKNGGKVGKQNVYFNLFDASRIYVIHPVSGERITAYNSDPRILRQVSFAEVNARRVQNKANNSVEEDSTAPRHNLSDNKLKTRSRKRPHVVVPEDDGAKGVTFEEMLSEDSGYAPPEQGESDILLDSNSQGFRWEEG